MPFLHIFEPLIIHALSSSSLEQPMQSSAHYSSSTIEKHILNLAAAPRDKELMHFITDSIEHTDS